VHRRLRCAQACLARYDVEPDVHVVLAEHGVAKRQHTDPDPTKAHELTQQVAALIRDRWPSTVRAAV
jgi:uncharacterized metal-binding protein